MELVSVRSSSLKIAPAAVGGARIAAGQRQAGDRHDDGRIRITIIDVEDARGIVAVDGQQIGPGADDRHVVGDLQLAAGQHDRPAQAGGEVDRVQAGIGVGVEDRLPQRAEAAVVGIRDEEGADDGDLTGAARSGINSVASGPLGYVNAGQAPGEAARPSYDADAAAAATATTTSEVLAEATATARGR